MPYVIESTMRATPAGGDWNGPWTTHTTLKETTLRDARKAFRDFRRMWTSDVQQHFRLTRHRPGSVKVLTA